MATVIKLKSSSTPGAVPAPSSLQTGEAALNLADGKIFVKDTLNNIKTVASGTIEGLADVDFSTAPTNNQLLSFDGATSKWVPITSGSAIGSTDDLAEGTTNLYYTTARANTDFDARLTTKTTDNVSEGSTNLYYTTARTNTDFDTRLATKSTDDVAEGSSNLYYTDARADGRISAAILTDIGNVNVPGSTTAGNMMVVNGTGDGYTWVPQKKVLDDLNNVNAGSPTDGQFLQWDNSTNKWIPGSKEPTALSYTAGTTTLSYSDENGNTTNIDLSGLLDEDSRSIASGTLDSGTGIVTFTRDDGTTFTMDLSALLDDTNLVTSVAGKTGVVTLDTSNVTEHTSNLYYTNGRFDSRFNTKTTDNLTEGSTNLYYTDARVDARIPTNVSTFTNDSNYLTSVASLTDIGDIATAGSTNAGNQLVVHSSGTGYVWVPQKKLLVDLNDIDAGSPSDGQALVYDSGTSKWIPGNGGIALTNLSVTQNSASGTGTLAYDNSTGVFTYTPPVIPTVLTDLSIIDGAAGQVLTTDGAGTFSFTTVSSGGGTTVALLTDIGNVNAPGSLTAGNQMIVNGAGTGYTWVPQKKVLDDLNNVDAGSPNTGDVLTWDGSSNKWIPATVSSGGGGSTTLADLTDTTIGTPSDGQALVYDSGTSAWVPGTATGYTDAQADARIAAASIADLNDVSGTTTDGDILTYNAATSSYEFQAGFSLTVPSESSEAINGEILQWDFANNEFVIKDMYDLATSQRISREETATQVIYRFN